MRHTLILTPDSVIQVHRRPVVRKGQGGAILVRDGGGCQCGLRTDVMEARTFEVLQFQFLHL